MSMMVSFTFDIFNEISSLISALQAGVTQKKHFILWPWKRMKLAEIF